MIPEMTETQKTNVLIEGFTKGWGIFDDALPFDRILPEHYLPAMQRAKEKAEQQIQAIKDTQQPDFHNVIVALEQAGKEFDIIHMLYDNLYSAHTNDELKAINEQVVALHSSFKNDVLFDAELFAKVNEVYNQINTSENHDLQAEDLRLLSEMYKNFAAQGALLPADKKSRLREINEAIDKIQSPFMDNVRNATNAFSLLVEDENDVKEMPPIVLAGAREEAQKKGHDTGWLFTLHAPSYGPFMKYCSNSKLREKMVRAFATRAAGGEYDNKPFVKELTKLRFEKAQILGFATYADYVLSRRMAKDFHTVQEFETKLKNTYYEAAAKEASMLKEFAAKEYGVDDLQVWDVVYYEEKLKEKMYNFSDEELRPYFQVDKVVEGVFLHAQKLYGLSFIHRTDIPVYHEDVKVYEVRSEAGDYIGLFYTDFFPRESKRQGAWMTEFRGQGLMNSVIRRPHVSIVCNFTKPTADMPSLITHEEVTTLFHEFGHALHSLLTQCQYVSLSGTNVRWDFVELPSQMMEQWAFEKEGLDLYAVHYQTGEKIPQEYINKLQETQNYMIGAFGLGQVKYGLLDLIYHGSTTGVVEDVMQAENELMAPLSLYPHLPERSISSAFSHIFCGGYDAGYYSYKWAEVLDADAFSYFKEKGIFNKEVADAFRKNILERGNTEEPMDLYVKFRGRKPDPLALHRREGLVK